MSINKILVSQQTPVNPAPYTTLQDKYNVAIEFRQFFKVEPLSSKEFRAQRVNVLDYSAVVFSSKHAIDAYFHICEELRIKVPETMKYFCTTEAVANYLQKHIVYRKRKIFFGNGTPQSVIDAIGSKHKEEKFLMTTSDSGNAEAYTSLFENSGLEYKAAAFIKSVSQDVKDMDIKAYDLVVVFNPYDIKSLYENYPDFQQGNTKFITYGKTVVKSMEEAGLEAVIKAPNPDCSSVASAIECYLKNIA